VTRALRVRAYAAKDRSDSTRQAGQTDPASMPRDSRSPLKLLQLSLRLQGHASGAPARAAPAGLGCQNATSSRDRGTGARYRQEPGGGAGLLADSRRRPVAPFRAGALRARRHRCADPPHPQAGGPRRYAPAMSARAQAGRAVLLAPGMLSPGKITVKGAHYVRVAGAMALRATLEQ